MPIFGSVHLALLASIAAIAAALALICRRRPAVRRTVRLALGTAIATNEIVWWIFRYSHEGLHVANLPLQLCDLSVWATAGACFRAAPLAVEFAYFAGLAGAGMALLTPDLWSPWPSYPAIYFFVAHGGVVTAVLTLTFGKVAFVRRGAAWRAFGMLAVYAAAVGAFDAAFGTNYMYLRHKPANPSLLDWFGPWPWYLLGGFAVGLALFWLLSVPLPRDASR